jgi:hypothetical protein
MADKAAAALRSIAGNHVSIVPTEHIVVRTAVRSVAGQTHNHVFVVGY